MPADSKVPFALGPAFGRGGQGEVFGAFEPHGETPLAVKIQRGASRHGAGSMRREYQLLRELDHPAFPRVFGCGRTSDGRTWLAMERFEGATFSDWAKALPAGARRTRRIVGRMADVADAVAYLHRLAVVHGDLKPNNILVAADGAPKILDLGGAHVPIDEVRRGRGFYRTVGYAPPEQIAKRELAPSADVYALATTLARVLGDAADEPIATLLALCMHADPDERPRDAAAFAEALRALAPAPALAPPLNATHARLREQLRNTTTYGTARARADECTTEVVDHLRRDATELGVAIEIVTGDITAEVIDRVAPQVERGLVTLVVALEDPARGFEPDLVTRALALATGSRHERVGVATLASGTDLEPTEIRRRLDALARDGVVACDAFGRWGFTRDVDVERDSALAVRLADEWEDDPIGLGRAHVLMHAGRLVEAADVAQRWARGVDDVERVAAGLDRLATLDALDGRARIAWLALRVRAAAAIDPYDTRIDGWISALGERAGELILRLGLWRGLHSDRALASAQTSFDQGRYDSALAVARGECDSAAELGALDRAGAAAFIAGQALAALGRLDEAARALADADAWWPEVAGRGLIAAERAAVLAALGRWGEAQRVLLTRVTTPFDRAALTIAAASLAVDRGHTAEAMVLLERAPTHPRLRTRWAVERMRAATMHGSRDEALAREVEPLVVALIARGHHPEAARLGAWQACAARDGELARAAVALLENGHRLWWAEAAIVATWLDDGTIPETLRVFFDEAGAHPLAMRAALAERDHAAALREADRFLAHLDDLSKTAIELMPWYVRARAQEAR